MTLSNQPEPPLLSGKPVMLRELTFLIGQALKHGSTAGLREEFWHKTGFLPRIVRNRLEQEEDCFAYLLRHSFRRPRDLISGLMESIIRECVASGTFPYISEKDIVVGVHNPRTLETILRDALTPYEGKLSDTFLRNARTEFQDAPAIMTHRQLRHFGQRLYSLQNLPAIEPEKFTEQLIQCGVIGVLKEISSKYCKARFEYMMSSTIATEDRFSYCAHPAMADAFGMKVPEKNVSIYPMSENDTWLEEITGIIEKK